jgi:uncharacterized protein
MSESIRPVGFHLMAKPAGPLCNLDCLYCFYLEKEKLYPAKTSLAMPEDVLEEYIRRYIESQDAPTVNFAWQGGEPTILGVDYFENIVRLQGKYANGKRIENALQTNGVLIDERWARFLAENQFLVGLSIDGPRQIHDRYRRDRGGNPTFDRVMRGLDHLKKHSAEFNTLTVVQSDNSQHPLEVYHFLKEIGSRFMQFIPIVERETDQPGQDGLILVSPDNRVAARVTDWSVEPLQFGRFLCGIFDEWVRSDVGQYYVQLFDVTLEAWMGLPSSLCIFRETCGEAMIIEHNGDLYACDHYVYPENRLGNIQETPMPEMASSNIANFGSQKALLPQQCRDCPYLFACRGECPKHRFVPAGEGAPDLNYLCEGYFSFFRHVAPAMDFMAEELRHRRPPANIMAHTRLQDLRAAVRRRPGRNDPCLCGSGKKFKKCCGSDR